MTDLKTSQEAAASTLTGTELIRAVQAGGNVAATAAQLRTFTLSSPSVSTGAITFNQNASLPPASTPSFFGTMLYSIDASQTGYQAVGFGTQATNILYRANGTGASPSKLTSGTNMALYGFGGFNGAGTWNANTALIRAVASEDWNDAAHVGTNLTFSITPAAGVQTVGMVMNGSTGGVKVGIGTETNPQQILVVSNNVTTGITGLSGTVALVGADGAGGNLSLFSFGNNPTFAFCAAGGTAAIPSATGAAATLGLFGGRSWHDGAFTTNISRIQFKTLNAQTSTDQSSQILFDVTPIASTTIQTGMIITGASGGSRVGIGTETNPQFPCVISVNPVTGITASAATGIIPALLIVGPDAANTAIELSAYGGNTANFFFSASGGPASAPAVVNANQAIGQFGARGVMSVGPTAYTSSKGLIRFVAAEAFSSSANGTYISFHTTTSTTTTLAEAMRLQNSGGLTIGSGIITTDPGQGNLLVQGIYKSSVAPTAVAGAGPIAIGSASTINNRMKVNLNGTDYWIPCSTTAF